MSEAKRPKRKRITESVDPKLVADVGFLQELIDTFPAMSFVVEEDVTVVAFNTSASRFLHIKADALRHLTGQVISCANAMNTPCGRSKPCKDCDVRLAINSAYKGFPVERKQTTMKLVLEGKVQQFHLLVTTKPYRQGMYTKVLLFIENITEYVTLQQLIPAFEKCATIADDPEAKAILDNYLQLRAHSEGAADG